MNNLKIYGTVVLVFGVALFIATQWVIVTSNLPIWYVLLAGASSGLLSREGYDWLRGKNWYES